MEGPLQFLQSFPFGKELVQQFDQHDLLTGEVEGSMPLLMTLSETDLEICLRCMSLGKRKWVWRELQRWKREWKERKLSSKSQNKPWAKRRKKKGAYPKANGDDALELSSTDISSSDEDDAKLPKSRNSRKKETQEAKKSVLTNGLMHQQSCPSCIQRVSQRVGSVLLPERWKTLIAFIYVLVVSWLTAFVMVIVHDRVPDMQRYPPLPDLLLDNLPHIPWAFEMCELTGMILCTVWFGVCLFHKHRFILLRRFFAITGTIFLLRCVTMLITSLSVPGKHLECAPRPYGDVYNKLYNAYVIWTGAGMSLQGVRTCGDYMFSGHTVSLTILNFFITEYTSRKIYFLHTFTWICNVFGVFFILAAHEHYSIDVFIAFYITSRLFLYYHTLANNKGSGKIGKRAWFSFPMFYFFEANVEGKVPNEFAWPLTWTDIQSYLNELRLQDTTRPKINKVKKN